MITRDYLLSHPDDMIELRQPSAFSAMVIMQHIIKYPIRKNQRNTLCH